MQLSIFTNLMVPVQVVVNATEEPRILNSRVALLEITKLKSLTTPVVR